MDAIDYRILERLQGNGRTTQLELSREVGLSQPAVAERIRKLEERGVILGYNARVDPAALGKDICAFVDVTIEHPKYFEAFTRKVLAMPEVLECHRVAGAASYLLKVRTENTRTLDTLLVQALRTIPGVNHTHTTIVLATVKEDTVVHVSEERIAGSSR